MIDVEALTKIYNDPQHGPFVAVDGISFQANAGEIFGVLGPNGAGKTTTLRMISTLLRPTSGSIRIAGADVVKDADSVRKSIGFVSNNTALYDRMSAHELVEYFGKLHGIEHELLQSRIEKNFERLHISKVHDIPCGKMSTGMKQKVSIARALIHDPPVLVFDEASVGLDVMVARSLLVTIASLREQGKCIIFSTHIMREVEKLCDRVAIMHRGKILDVGTLEELAERHAERDFEELFFKLLSRHEPAANSLIEQDEVAELFSAELLQRDQDQKATL